MKTYFNLLTPLSIVIFLSLGCSFMGSDEKPANGQNNASNKTITDKAVDTTVGKSNIGVPECDQVIDAIEAELNNSEDDFVTKAVKATVLNRLKDGIKQSVEENQTDKVELAKTCKEFKTQFDKYKAEEQNKQSQ